MGDVGTFGLMEFEKSLMGCLIKVEFWTDWNNFWLNIF